MTKKSTKAAAIESSPSKDGTMTSPIIPPSKPALGHNESGALVSGSSSKLATPRVSTEDPSVSQKVAIFSTKNVYWEGIGRVRRGYNFVTKDASDKWLQRSHIRLASLEEIQAL